MLNLLSTRLFPKDLGASEYQITGIAAKCDWVVLSDRCLPQIHVHKNFDVDEPNSIFLSMRAHEIALRYFVRDILPKLRKPFVLITGSEDATMPNQIDQRLVQLNEDDRDCIQSLLKHPLLLRWAVENLDDASHPLTMPIPTGMIYTDDPKIRATVDVPYCSKLRSRPLNILCGHRVRDGGQWDLRKSISETARANWSDWCTVLDEEVPEPEFLDLIKSHSFVLCAEGGGLDPSPKAWQSILHGAIPIIRKSALYSAYRQLPVAFVDDWSKESITPLQLVKWRTDLIKHYDEPDLRKKVLEKLCVDYWWKQVMDITQ